MVLGHIAFRGADSDLLFEKLLIFFKYFVYKKTTILYGYNKKGCRERKYYMKTVNYRKYLKALKALRAELRIQTGGCDVEVFELNTDEQPVQLGINWHSIGTVDIDSAKNFAAAIANAVSLVEDFEYNGYMLEY